MRPFQLTGYAAYDRTKRLALHCERTVDGRCGCSELRRKAVTLGWRLTHPSSTAQWKAERAFKRPKPVKMHADPGWRTYAQDRLAVHVLKPDGTRAAVSAVAWNRGQQRGSTSVDRSDRDVIRAKTVLMAADGLQNGA